MISMSHNESFGAASGCCNLLEALELIRANPAVPAVRVCAAARGMALHASQAVRDSGQFDDTRFVLDQLALAKAEIDIAAWHSAEVVAVTEAILGAAQRFLNDETVGCNEWPTPSEVASVVLKVAGERAAA